MIVATFEGGEIMIYLKRQDSSEIEYDSFCLKEVVAGEVQNLLISPYSNHFIVIADDRKLFDHINEMKIEIGRAFDFLDE